MASYGVTAECMYQAGAPTQIITIEYFRLVTQTQQCSPDLVNERSLTPLPKDNNEQVIHLSGAGVSIRTGATLYAALIGLSCNRNFIYAVEKQNE